MTVEITFSNKHVMIVHQVTRLKYSKSQELLKVYTGNKIRIIETKYINNIEVENE